MASLQAQAEAVKSAVSSITTCTAATTILLKDLILPKDTETAPDTVKTTRPTNSTRTTKPKDNGASKAAGTKAKASAVHDGKDELSAKEKAILATHVINATLKSLGHAAKPPPPTPAGEQVAGEESLVKTATKRRLRRSNSAPVSPMQPRSVNRTAMSPVTTKHVRSNSISNSNGCLSTVECARVAFLALRTLQNAGKVTLPELQLESGMSSLVGKLIGLGLTEHALKELRLLKRRLDGLVGVDQKKTSNASTSASIPNLADILDFSDIKTTAPVLNLIITTQIHVLRILSKLKRPSNVEAALPFLRSTCKTSPTSLLLLSTTSKGADQSRAARQLETVSQLLLSMTPSVSSDDDDTALETRLSVSPATALEIQTIGLNSRLHWWKLAGHQGEVDKEILSPFSRCLVAYIRRSRVAESSSYKSCFTAFSTVYDQVLAQNLTAKHSSKSPLASIYQALATMARESGRLQDAILWSEKLSQIVDRKEESAAKCCAVSAQLLALRLKEAWKYSDDDALLKEVLEGIQGPLRGDSTELDELLANLFLARKSVMGVILGNLKDEEGQKHRPSAQTLELLETLVLQLPRFCLRWLGKAPTSTGNTKDFVRYEQRRALLSKSGSQILDSVLMLIKSSLDENRMTWDSLDSLLRDSVGLLEDLGHMTSSDASNSYYAKISHLYYMQFTRTIPNPIKETKDIGPSLKALRRSIECVKYRPSKEREKAQIVMKLERMSELCKASGRIEDALGSLQSIRSILIEDNVLRTVAEATSNLPPQQAWTLSKKTESLSRALRSIAKLEQVWMDWTVDLEEPERLAALEHRLQFILLGSSRKRASVGLSDSCVEALLLGYSAERFPIRRLRILLRLLVANLGNEEQLEEIQSQAEAVTSISGQAELCEDSALGSYLSHLKALYASTAAMILPNPDHRLISQSVSAWRSILDTCKTAADLDQQIDDLPGLLEHLQYVADFARLSNRDSLLLDTLQLSADFGKIASGSVHTDNLEIIAALALQLTNAGQSSKAAEILEHTYQQFQHQQTPGHETVIRFHLSYAEYFLETGNIEKADECLDQAKKAAMAIELSNRSKSQRILVAHASLVHSSIALARGDAHRALLCVRNSVRILFQEWTRLEQQAKSLEQASRDKSIADGTSMTIAADTTITATITGTSGPEFWKLAYPVLRSLVSLSSTYAHLGMYQETMYYAEQAHKIAKSTMSDAYLTQCAVWIASVSIRAGKLDNAMEMVNEARTSLRDDEYSSNLISLHCQLSAIYREARDFEKEALMLEAAEGMARRMTAAPVDGAGEADTKDVAIIETKMTKLSIKEKSTRAPRKAKVPVVKKALKKVPASKVAPKIPPVESKIAVADDAHLVTLKTSIAVEKAFSMIHQKNWSGAWKILQEAHQSSKLTTQVLSELVAMARSLLGQSMEQMSKDAVYSVIQDSTLSFPSVCSSPGSARASDRHSLTPSPLKTRRAGYLENLREAREHLLEAHAMASIAGDGSLVHKILSMLQSVVLLLSAASSSSKRSGLLGHPGYATCSLEMARNLTWRRERKALLSETGTAKSASLEWPEEIKSAESRRTSLSSTIDMNRLQREYIDIIPQEWSVVSISLSDNKHDLCISRLQAGQSPFVIRLPLDRASSRDANSEVFNFRQGRAELLEIIQQANATCHDSRDMSVKGAKTAWWAEREDLDNRLGELLQNVEQIWLGGFRGIFSQHQRHPDLLARFHKSFQNILDKHLPSRRQVRGKKAKTPVSKVALDPRILELFIGLGDATAAECDFDEALNDLLYFVVDILQFHGERNAYDEIDFDVMTMETFDALHSYHSTVNNHTEAQTRSHTILVLDKALHVFPWESIPCLQGLAVSRVPSLACLRRLISEQRRPTPTVTAEIGQQEPAAEPSGHKVSLKSGSYILNPGADLKTTQDTFDKPLSSSLGTSWKRIVARVPSETEFETALSDADILLYFGHGSGAQYIKGRTIRKLEKCRATVLLMGCSSASLADVGDFECHGPVWNYMLAGCPAVVGTLWDVTDRDIDRFAARVFDEWGLIGKGSIVEKEADVKGKGKGKAKGKAKAAGAQRKKAGGDRDAGDTACEYGNASLVEAVARAKQDACRFKYLTAAAVCVYGIPVYVDRGDK